MVNADSSRDWPDDPADLSYSWSRTFYVCLCFVVHYFVSFLILHQLVEEERAGCFAFIVLRMSCYCKCSVTLPHVPGYDQEFT